MKNIIVFFLFMMLLCTGCKNNVVSNKTDKDYSHEYIQAKEMFLYFPDSLITHLPKNVDSPFAILMLYPDTNVKYSAYTTKKIFVIRYLDDIQLEQLRDSLLKSSLSIINADDKNVLIINRGHRDIELLSYDEKFKTSVEDRADRLESLNEIEKKESENIINSDVQYNLPICNFSFAKLDGYHISDSNRLSSEFKLYILNAEKGEKYIVKDSLIYDYGLPSYWQHGYSKGIALNQNENIVVYWLEIW